MRGYIISSPNNAKHRPLWLAETGCKCRYTIEENRLTDWKCKMLSDLTAFSDFIIEGAHRKSKIKTRRKILRIV